MSDINNQVSKKVTYTAYSPYEFDRRLNILKEHKEDVEEIIRTKKVGKHRNKSLKLLLAAVFGLLSESLASRRGDKTRELAAVEYIEARYKALSSFFFSSYETDSELTRRSLALIDALGDNAEWFLRTKRVKPNVTEEKVAITEDSITVEEAKVQATSKEVCDDLRHIADLYSDMESKLNNKDISSVAKVSESELWLEIQKQEDFKQLRSEIKSMFPEVIEDPSNIVALANKIGINDLLARVRRSYFFNSKD